MYDGFMKQVISQDGNGYTLEECVDFALQNEAESGNEGLWMSRGTAHVYADGYRISSDDFFRELLARGWEPREIA